MAGGGVAGLRDRSRRPQANSGQTLEVIAAAVVALRHAHPCWGGGKIRRVLEWAGRDLAPAAPTIAGMSG